MGVFGFKVTGLRGLRGPGHDLGSFHGSFGSQEDLQGSKK